MIIPVRSLIWAGVCGVASPRSRLTVVGSRDQPVGLTPILRPTRHISPSLLQEDGCGSVADVPPTATPGPRVAHYFAVEGAGRSELKMSITAFHDPSVCFFHTSTNFPLSIVVWFNSIAKVPVV